MECIIFVLIKKYNMKDNIIIKKATRELVHNKIEGALSELKSGVQDKKFSKKLKKASKILAKDITRVIEKSIAKKVAADKKLQKENEKANAKTVKALKKSIKVKKEKLGKPEKNKKKKNSAPNNNNQMIPVPVTESVNAQ